MQTVVIPAIDNAGNPDLSAIEQAADLLGKNEVVAFPTETVYGLGANALRPEAVQKIFEAKGRPANNPLIVHVADIEQARSLVTHWPAEADDLARAFWPGPLTLVLKKSAMVPDNVTAGGTTVALRVPSHPVALALIRTCGFPIAAPSANRSNYLSPTTAAHVIRSLRSVIPMILDGGPCQSGIESTVLNLTASRPTILRPGVLSKNFLKQFLNSDILLNATTSAATNTPMISPGQLAIHYSPDTQLVLVDYKDLSKTVSEFKDVSAKIGLIHLSSYTGPNVSSRITMPPSPELYAQQIYAALHELDDQELNVIVCELPPDSDEWAGIRDRLSRAGQKPH